MELGVTSIEVYDSLEDDIDEEEFVMKEKEGEYEMSLPGSAKESELEEAPDMIETVP